MKEHTVLIVDDEPLILDVWTRILFVAGYDVECATDALEAFHALHTARVRVAICYVHPPAERGLRIADMIREQFPATAIILASDDRLVTRPDALGAAVVDYIVPPVSSERLLTIVRTGIAWSLDKTRVH